MRNSREVLVILFFCTVKLLLHLIGDSNSGFQGDELLHIATGNHLSFGYMEFPPVIGWLAFIQNLFHSQSVFVHHIFSHIASVLIMILVALTTMKLGGKIKAIFIILLCIVVAPTFGRAHQLFQPVVFSQFFWVLSFYQLVCFNKTLNHKYLWYLTVSLAFGFLTKYDILFFIAGLPALLIFRRTRRAILTKYFLGYIALFLVLISPNIWWQYINQFPVFDMFTRLYEIQLDHLTILDVLKEIIISLNPLTIILWLAGLFFMFNKRDRNIYRPIAVTIVLSILLLALNKSKAYYFYPAMIPLLIFGCIWFEKKILAKRYWVIYPATILLVLSGIVLVPFGLAVFPLQTFIKFAHIKQDGNRYPIEFSEYYAPVKWRNTMTALQQVYDSLPNAEKQNCLIWGKHYSQAGGVNLFRESYNLPEAFSYHGSFYLWTKEKGPLPKTIIAITNGEAEIDFFQSFFNSVVPVKRVYNPYASFDKDLWQTIFICKDPKQDFEGLKRAFRTRIFE